MRFSSFLLFFLLLPGCSVPGMDPPNYAESGLGNMESRDLPDSSTQSKTGKWKAAMGDLPDKTC